MGTFHRSLPERMSLVQLRSGSAFGSARRVIHTPPGIVGRITTAEGNAVAMKTLLIAYVAAGITFLVIDAIWLTVMADTLYRPLLGDRLAETYHFWPAAIFYLIYISGILALAVMPALETGHWQKAALNGAILGFVAYATYDLTNQATLKDWPTAVTVADLMWGTVLTTVASTAGFFAASRFG
jgi:uncharacterized membrane protein